jgi:hypothetical protein
VVLAGVIEFGQGAPAIAATEAEKLVYVRDLKRMQVDIMMQQAKREMAERKELLRRYRARLRRPGQRLTFPRTREEREPVTVARGRPAPDAVLAGLAPNRRMNNRSTDLQFPSTQSEVSLAAHGRFVLAAWNDGETPIAPGPIGFATSTDNGATWSDGGSLPVTDSLPTWQSDPVVTVDERTGTFYLVGLAISTHPLANALAVLAGRFEDDAFQWQPLRIVRSPRDTLPDKPWIAADSLTGRLYVTYTTFFFHDSTRTDQIEFQWSADGNVWSPPAKISADRDDGLVQGSRPAVGPTGDVHVVWSAVDTSATSGGLDWLRARTSRDGGRHFEPVADVTSVYSNFGSGAPGFNRGYGINFPSVAVDRSDGPTRGRIYLCWTESLNYFDDVPIPGGPGVDRDAAEGTVPTSFEIGDVLRGQIEPGVTDLYGFHAREGETLVFHLDSLARGLDVALRVECAAGGTGLAFNSAPGSRRRFLIVTAPATDDYVVLVSPNTSAVGGYRVLTALARHEQERGRDQRDVFVAWSDDGEHWSPPSRVNDEPPRNDDWFPEVAVAANGRVYVMWFDWRESPTTACGALSSISLSRSDDYGTSWTRLGALSDRTNDWSLSASNLVPNQGDYLGLYVNDAAVYGAWPDVRARDPDAFFARYDLSRDPPAPPAPPTPIAFEGVQPNPSAGDAVIAISVRPGAAARVVLVDLTGRHLETVEVPPSKTGKSQVRFERARLLPPGIYLLKLTQGADATMTRYTIVR